MKNSLQKIPSFVRFHKSKGIRKEKKGLHSISKLQFIIHHLHIEDMLYKKYTSEALDPVWNNL